MVENVKTPVEQLAEIVNRDFDQARDTRRKARNKRKAKLRRLRK